MCTELQLVMRDTYRDNKLNLSGSTSFLSHRSANTFLIFTIQNIIHQSGIFNTAVVLTTLLSRNDSQSKMDQIIVCHSEAFIIIDFENETVASIMCFIDTCRLTRRRIHRRVSNQLSDYPHGNAVMCCSGSV